MRTPLLISMAIFLLACGDEAPDDEGGQQSKALVAPVALTPGVRSLETEILRSEVIVLARLTAPHASVATDASLKHRPTVRFNFTIREVLKGTYSATAIDGIWISNRPYDTPADATARSRELIAERDSQWDNHDAILLLRKGTGHNVMSPEFNRADSHYLLGLEVDTIRDDQHSLHSRHHRTWLPSANTGSGDDREFLLTPPTDDSAVLEHPNGHTVTLRKMKQLVSSITAEYNGGDGSDAYKTCIRRKYEAIETSLNTMILHRVATPYWNTVQTIESGQPAGTTLAEREYALTGTSDYEAGTVIPDAYRPDISLVGRDGDLFEMEPSTVRVLYSGTKYEEFEYDEVLQLARPLPVATYVFQMETRYESFKICSYVFTNEFTVNVSAPPKTLHELFFDPVTAGNTVAADSTNGVLKPASFTDANSASATIESISYEPPSAGSDQAGTVKLEVAPHTGLANHVLDIIELDSTVSLSLKVADATVDAANNTLTWSVSSQPWHDGDLLMVRIREGPP